MDGADGIAPEAKRPAAISRKTARSCFSLASISRGASLDGPCKRTNTSSVSNHSSCTLEKLCFNQSTRSTSGKAANNSGNRDDGKPKKIRKEQNRAEVKARVFQRNEADSDVIIIFNVATYVFWISKDPPAR